VAPRAGDPIRGSRASSAFGGCTRNWARRLVASGRSATFTPSRKCPLRRGIKGDGGSAAGRTGSLRLNTLPPHRGQRAPSLDGHGEPPSGAARIPVAGGRLQKAGKIRGNGIHAWRFLKLCASVHGHPQQRSSRSLLRESKAPRSSRGDSAARLKGECLTVHASMRSCRRRGLLQASSRLATLGNNATDRQSRQASTERSLGCSAVRQSSPSRPGFHALRRFSCFRRAGPPAACGRAVASVPRLAASARRRPVPVVCCALPCVPGATARSALSCEAPGCGNVPGQEALARCQAKCRAGRRVRSIRR